MKKTIVILLAVLLLTACGGTAETPPTTTYSNPSMGIQFEYPEDWVSADSFGGTTVASSQALIDGESMADIGDGGFVIVLPIEREVLNFQTGQTLEEGDAVGAANLYKTLLEREGGTYVVSQPIEEFDIDGQPAAQMILRTTLDGTNMLVLLGAISANDQVVLYSASAQEVAFGDQRATFEQIIDSMQASPPQ